MENNYKKNILRVSDLAHKYYPFIKYVDKEYLSYCGSFGSAVHKVVECRLKDIEDDVDAKQYIDSNTEKQINKIMEYFNEGESEKYLGSDMLQGTADLIKDNVIYDLKTSNNIQASMDYCILQLNLYASLAIMNGYKIEALKIIHSPRGGKEVHLIEIPLNVNFIKNVESTIHQLIKGEGERKVLDSLGLVKKNPNIEVQEMINLQVKINECKKQILEFQKKQAEYLEGKVAVGDKYSWDNGKGIVSYYTTTRKTVNYKEVMKESNVSDDIVLKYTKIKDIGAFKVSIKKNK